MNAIWYLSKERNIPITGFNKVDKEDKKELWVREIDGSSRKLATEEDADALEEALLKMIWANAPAIITDGNGNFSTNITINENEEVE